MRNFRFLQPDSVSTVLKAKEEERENGRILAGGTNLLSYIKMGRVKEGLLIDITRLDELKQIEDTENEVSFGASLTITELLNSSVVQNRLSYLHDTLTHFANPLIRNQATLGGNIADGSPIADTIPILLVLDATVTAASSKSERIIPLKEFFVGPGKTVLAADELLVKVSVPVHESSGVKMIKLGLRNGTACSVTSAAVRVEQDNKKLREIRIALGGVAPTPIRAYNCENALLDGLFDIEAAAGAELEALQQDINPISDVRGTAEYRRGVSVNLVKRALRSAAGMEV
ncbi:MAG: xanthine dehydrogenase family protein subunit M [Spirochaetia bacterium]|nr:xanthine dehydrogenase family protein subunit M [Spirochaetia bacterium]